MVKTAPAWIDAHGIASRGRDLLASMGIYLFNRETLLGRADEDRLPRLWPRDFPGIDSHAARADAPVRRLLGGHRHDPLVLRMQPGPGRDRIRRSTWPRPKRRSTRARGFLPPSKLDGATIEHSLIADGCEIEEGTTIENSVIGLRCQIGRNVTIRNSVIMGSDEYESPAQIAQAPRHAASRPWASARAP